MSFPKAFLPLLAASCAAVCVISCAPPEKPPAFSVHWYDWSDLQLDQVKPGDWVEYLVRKRHNDAARKRRVAFLRTGEDGIWIEMTPGEGVPDGWVLLARLARASKAVQACWIGRPGQIGHAVIVELPAPAKPGERNEFEDIIKLSGVDPGEVKERRGEIWPETLRVGGGYVSCEKVVTETTRATKWERRKESEATWWSRDVPAFYGPKPWWRDDDVIWRDKKCSWGGLVRRDFEDEVGSVAEMLTGYGHDAVQTVIVPETK